MTSNHRLSSAFDKSCVTVVLSSSNLYVPYTGVFIQSLLDHASRKNNYDIVILETKITDSNKRLLKNLSDGRTNVSIRFYNPAALLSAADVSDLYHDNDWPLEVTCKLLAPYIMKDTRRLVAIDSDILLKRDIADLQAADLKGHSIGGVFDIVWQGFYALNYTFAKNQTNIREYCENILPIRNPYEYANCGVLVFDCERFRQKLEMRDILKTAQSRTFLFVEQCVLNLLMEGDIEFLDYGWNVQIPLNLRSKHAVDSAPEQYQEAYQRACERPYVLHWPGKPKPWVCPDVAFGSEWWKTAMETPFMGHIIARMVDELEIRREYYTGKYGTQTAVWEPVPQNIARDLKKT